MKRSRSRATAAGTNGSAYSCACVCGSEAPASLPSFTITCTYAASSWARMRSRHTDIAVSTWPGSSSASEVTGSGALMTTSCAPVAGRLANRSGSPRP